MVLDLSPKDEVCLRLREDDVRRTSIVEFISDNRIIVEQTTPAMSNASLMSLMFFTYCTSKQKNKRMGFQGRIESITPDDRIIIRQMTMPFVCDLRLWPRVHFDLLPQMRAYCHDQEIKVVDISGGGTHIILQDDDDAPPATGALVEIKFMFDTGETTADGKILRVWTDAEALRHVEIQFIGKPEIRDFIYRKSRAA